MHSTTSSVRSAPRLPRLLAVAGLPLLALAVAAPGVAAQEADQRWLPWVGCWEPASGAEAGGMLCFRPDAGGVELLTVEDGEVTAREALRADGMARPRDAEGCRGTEAVRFSDDGRRIFLASEQRCDGGAVRSASGIIAMVAPSAWIDVKSVDVEGDRFAVAELYYAVPDQDLAGTGLEGLTSGREMAIETARVAASRAITTEQVVEASGAVHEQTVQAWLAEAADPFALDAGVVESLAARGVAPGTIDVMVAVTYPERFALSREAVAERRVDAGDRRADAREAYGLYRGPRSPFHWDPFYSSAYRFRYGAYGYGYGVPGYGYDPYGRWGFYQPTVVIVQPEATERGRVINGQGYTRSRGGQPAGARGAAAPTRGTGTVGAPSRGSTGSTGEPPRRAKPRGGGGGSGGI